MTYIENLKNTKRWVSLLVAICLVIGLLPMITIPANATSLNGADYTSGVLAEKLDTIFSTGITNGLSAPFPAVDGTFSKSKMYSITFARTSSQWSGYQCAAYAKAVYNYLFGYDPASERYRQTFSTARTMGSLSFEDFQAWGVKFGAYLRTTANSSGAYDAFNGHSVIILSYNKSSIVTLEANLISTSLYQVQIKSRSWSNFNNDLFKNRYVCSLSQPLESIYANLDFGSGEIKDNQCIITFDPNGGSMSTNTMTVLAGSSIGKLPVPTRSGYTFICWSTAKEGAGSALTEDNYKWLTFDKDAILYAQWKLNCANHTYDADTCTNCGARLPYDNGLNESAAGTYQVSANVAYIRTGPYQVKDLVRTASQGEFVQVVGSVINSYNNTWMKTTDGYYVHADKLTLYSKTQDQSYYVILDNGSVCNRIKVTNGGTYGDLPTPSKEGYTFDGWFTSASGGVQVTASTTVSLTNNQTLYAHWTANPTQTTWGAWSAWSTTPYSASSTRQVETQQVKVSDAYTEYRYGLWRNTNNASWCPNYGASLSSSGGSWYESYSSWSKTRMYRDTGHNAFCAGNNHNHTHVAGYDSSGQAYWDIYSDDGTFTGWGRLYYYWEETRTIPAVYETQYRYRDLISA